MPDYNAYRKAVGISNPDMTKCLKTTWPAFSRVHSTFVNHPDHHAVCLTPEAEEHLVRTFGYGPGLQYAKKKRRPDKRRKIHSVTFRMNDDDWEKAQILQESFVAPSMQELFEILLRNAFYEREGSE